MDWSLKRGKYYETEKSRLNWILSEVNWFLSLIQTWRRKRFHKNRWWDTGVTGETGESERAGRNRGQSWISNLESFIKTEDPTETTSTWTRNQQTMKQLVTDRSNWTTGSLKEPAQFYIPIKLVDQILYGLARTNWSLHQVCTNGSLPKHFFFFCEFYGGWQTT